MPEETPPFDAGQIVHQVAQAVAQMREVLAPIEEAAAGYRKQLEQDGWSPTIAEHMAFELYRALMGQVAGGKS